MDESTPPKEVSVLSLFRGTRRRTCETVRSSYPGRELLIARGCSVLRKEVQMRLPL